MGKHIEAIAAAVAITALIWGLLWEGLSLSFFAAIILGLLLVSVHSFIRWKYLRWDLSQGKSDARLFGVVVQRVHSGVRLVLWIVLVVCTVGGLGAKHGPPWAAAEARRVLLHESPTTHPGLMIKPAPSDISIRPREPTSAGDAFLILQDGNEIRLETAVSVLREIIEGILGSLALFSSAVFFMASMLILMLWFVELIGKQTYQIPDRL